MGERPLLRALMALVAVSSAFMVGVTTEAEADDPEVCGYVRYGFAPTSTATIVTYCQIHCDGISPHVPPGQVAGFKYEALVCVRGL